MFTVNEMNFLKECVAAQREKYDPENNINANFSSDPYLVKMQKKCDHMDATINGILAAWFDHVIELSNEAKGVEDGERTRIESDEIS